jgi:hypothetical protein
MGRLAKSPAGNRRARQWRVTAMLAVFCCLCQSAFAQAADHAASLRDKYQSLTQQLAHNQFQRPLYLESQELPSALSGDIYGVVNYPFTTVNGTLNDPAQGPANWCDVRQRDGPRGEHRQENRGVAFIVLPRAVQLSPG